MMENQNPAPFCATCQAEHWPTSPHVPYTATQIQQAAKNLEGENKDLLEQYAGLKERHASLRRVLENERVTLRATAERLEGENKTLRDALERARKDTQRIDRMEAEITKLEGWGPNLSTHWTSDMCALRAHLDAGLNALDECAIATPAEASK